MREKPRGDVAPPERVEILGVGVHRTRGERVIERTRERMAAGERLTIAYANAHTLNLAVRDERFRAALNRCDLLLNDGVGVGLAARFKGRPFDENLNGSDFNLRLLETAARDGWKVFLFGGRPGVADVAAAKLSARTPDLEIAGTRHGFHGDPVADAAAVRESGADAVMVALGNPRQELWLAEHLAASGARLGVGVGGFLDFQAERVPRAPAWMNRAGVEWTYRLACEPGRLWRRYVLGNPAFVLRVLGELPRLQARPAIGGRR